MKAPDHAALYQQLLTEVRSMREYQIKHDRCVTQDNKRRKIATEKKVDALIGASEKPKQETFFN